MIRQQQDDQQQQNTALYWEYCAPKEWSAVLLLLLLLLVLKLPSTLPLQCRQGVTFTISQDINSYFCHSKTAKATSQHVGIATKLSLQSTVTI